MLVAPVASLLEYALERNGRSEIVLVSPDELEQLQCWSWWRRGGPSSATPPGLWVPYPVKREWGAYAIAWKQAA